MPLTKSFVNFLPEALMHERYDLDHSWILGSGVSGDVTAALSRSTGRWHALKSVSIRNLERDSVALLRSEVEMQSALDHPTIPKILEVFEGTESIHIIMEMCGGGSLLSHIAAAGRLDEDRARALVKMMLSAINTCHRNSVVHRDVKLDNFCFEDPSPDSELKLVDFGFACYLDRYSSEKPIGTLSYMAPEIFGDGDVGFEVDMWALGVCVYIMLSLRRPFEGATRAKVIRAIREEEPRYDLPPWDQLPAAAADFTRKLLVRDPRQRLTASAAMRHPWLLQPRSKPPSPPSEGPAAASFLAEKQVEALQAHLRAIDLQKLAFLSMAYSLSSTAAQELRDAFRRLDPESTGAIPRDRFVAALSGANMPQRLVDLLFKSLDVTQSSMVDHTEFMAALLSFSPVSRSRPSLQAAFVLLDRDGDGYITRADLIDLLSGPDHEYPRQELRKLVKQHEKIGDADGRLSSTDFKFLIFKGPREISHQLHKRHSMRTIKRNATDPSCCTHHPTASRSIVVSSADDLTEGSFGSRHGSDVSAGGGGKVPLHCVSSDETTTVTGTDSTSTTVPALLRGRSRRNSMVNASLMRVKSLAAKVKLVLSPSSMRRDRNQTRSGAEPFSLRESWRFPARRQLARSATYSEGMNDVVYDNVLITSLSEMSEIDDFLLELQERREQQTLLSESPRQVCFGLNPE